MSTVTLQLLQGNEIEVDLDIITEYGCFSVTKEIPTCYPYREIFPKYVAMGKTCYIKIYPSEQEIYITDESLERVYAAKKQELTSAGLTEALVAAIENHYRNEKDS